MFRNVMLVCAAVLLVFSVGCGKKKADTADMDIKPVTVEPEEVVPSPAPAPTQDEQTTPLSGDLVAANEYARESGLLGDVYFDFDRYELKSDARERLAKNAHFLQEHPEFTLTLEGHCDERGTNEYNLALGERRATTAVDYLVSLGVDRRRLKTVSYGEERPFCRTSSESCWAQNRRAHFQITGRTNMGR